MSRIAGRVLVALVPASFLLYAGYALLVAGWWLSGLAAPLVAALLVARRPRARFAAYIFLSVVALRAATTGIWWLLGAAALAILALQAPAARKVWPRLSPGGG